MEFCFGKTYFPTTGTLSAGPIRLAQPLQLPAPLQGAIISPGHTQLFYLVLSLGIFKANAFGPTRRLQNLTAVTRRLSSPSMPGTTLLEGQG